MRGVVKGLQYLHGQSPPVVHGDLKGSTVLVSSCGTILLSDIGITRIPQPPDWNFNDIDDSRWCAPEILYPPLRPEFPTNDAPSTPDSTRADSVEGDIYAFGMVSYEMQAREKPFHDTKLGCTVSINVVAGKRPGRPSQEHSPQLTDTIWELIQSCWAQDYRERRRC
ncbi:kinase-like domain-containing protein [Mycena crocata]|nr:kinase-like domain-containing protein [Mycena crocata]KAJ7124841.1 kinase-like domain-containing protein [Mycena crocata]